MKLILCIKLLKWSSYYRYLNCIECPSSDLKAMNILSGPSVYIHSYWTPYFTSIGCLYTEYANTNCTSYDMNCNYFYGKPVDPERVTLKLINELAVHFRLDWSNLINLFSPRFFAASSFWALLC